MNDIGAIYNTPAVTELAKVFAREVEFCAELARQVGHEVPREYDVALRLRYVDPPEVVEVHLSFNDVTFRFRWRILEFEEIRRRAGELVGRYLDAHPKIRADVAEDPLAHIDQLNEGTVYQAAIAASRKGTYEPRLPTVARR